MLVLVENRGRLLGKDELLRKVWPGTFVEESNLAQHISILRKALRDGEDGFQYIETVPRYGYRFIAEVRELGGIATDAAVLSDSTPSQPPFPVVPESGRLHHRLRGPAFVIAALVAARGFGLNAGSREETPQLRAGTHTVAGDGIVEGSVLRSGESIWG